MDLLLFNTGDLDRDCLLFEVDLDGDIDFECLLLAGDLDHCSIDFLWSWSVDT